MIMAAALILTIALPALAQPAPASRVTITIFPVYEGVRVEGMPFESKERADVGSTVLERWLSPVTVRVGSATITADRAVFQSTGEFELGGRVRLRVPAKSLAVRPRIEPPQPFDSPVLKRHTYFLHADEALHVLPEEEVADSSLAEVELRGNVRLHSALVEATAEP